MEDAKFITEDEHTEFYRFITGQYDKPRYTLQYKIDVPINLRALIYVPQYKPSMLMIDSFLCINRDFEPCRMSFSIRLKKRYILINIYRSVKNCLRYFVYN